MNTTLDAVANQLCDAGSARTDLAEGIMFANERFEALDGVKNYKMIGRLGCVGSLTCVQKTNQNSFRFDSTR